MTGRERMLKTLRFEEPDRPPHFEVMFELEQEAFGLQFPERHAWEGCSAGEKDRLVGQCMTIYEKIVARYCLEHGAPGGGYIFGTSNTVFPGMPLAHYEYMLEVYQEWVTEQGRRT
ncbi:MAG: hypothetical protein K9N49_10020 [Candidatus Marinimicrobia bacterium]|nr:hypothetical protein [Candidatus Neomarinimicrobiota bacterium]